MTLDVFQHLFNNKLLRKNEICNVKINKRLHQEIMINGTILKGNWEETKNKLKQRFAILTDNDLFLTDGKQDELLIKLQLKLGKSKEELQKILNELLIRKKSKTTD